MYVCILPREQRGTTAQHIPGQSRVISQLARWRQGAAARAAVEHAKLHKDELSQEDDDALTLYHLVPLLTSGMSPSYPELEATAVYKRGKEVHERLHGPVIPDLSRRDSGCAALHFEHRFLREPVPGDVLRYQDVFVCDLLCYTLFIAAWHRQIPELSCPLKVENDHMFYHQDPKYNDGQEWSGPDERALGDWCCVEREANDGNYLPAKDAPTIPAVVFLGLIDGKYKYRPATASEIQLRGTGLFPETGEEQANG